MDVDFRFLKMFAREDAVCSKLNSKMNKDKTLVLERIIFDF